MDSISPEEYRSAFELLRDLIPPEEVGRYDLTASPATVYTNLATLWLITLQCLGGGLTLVEVIKELKTRHLGLLPDNKRVRERNLSHRSGAFSRARSRLTVEMARQFAERVSQSLIELAPSSHQGQRVFVLDGTTITLSPTSALRKKYPPARNQLGESVWPVLLLLVAHELRSGVALIPELGAMYGADNTSEARMAAAMAKRIPAASLVMGDTGFGIFSVVRAMHDAGHQVLFRLSKGRFKALVRSAEPLAPAFRCDASGTIRNQDCGGQSWFLEWKPSPKDRRSSPDLADDETLRIVLHEVKLPNGEPLYLVTTTELDASGAAELYRRRYDVEFDIRDVKVTLSLESIRARSDDMVQKELLCGIVAYNLVQHLRRQAAGLAGVEPRRLSFTNIWTTMKISLLQQPPCSLEQWLSRYDEALKEAAQAKLPLRPNRSSPRKAHCRRQKTTQEQHRKKTVPDSIPPPNKTK